MCFYWWDRKLQLTEHPMSHVSLSWPLETWKMQTRLVKASVDIVRSGLPYKHGRHCGGGPFLSVHIKGSIWGGAERQCLLRACTDKNVILNTLFNFYREITIVKLVWMVDLTVLPPCIQNVYAYTHTLALVHGQYMYCMPANTDTWWQTSVKSCVYLCNDWRHQ